MIPVFSLDTGMPSIKVVPKTPRRGRGTTACKRPSVPVLLGRSRSSLERLTAPWRWKALAADAGIAQTAPQGRANGLALIQAVPKDDPSSHQAAQTIDRLRTALPAGALVGGAAAENHDLESALGARTALVIGVVLVLGFLLLLLALQAPVIAAIGVITNLLATGAAFGVAKLVFQDGHGAGILGFESQGFLNAWGPVFFFAMIFAISMDYTVFLLSSAKEHYDLSHDPREAAVGGVAHSGRVIFAAAAVMVAIFFTFALSGPLPPKEMGVILGVAVLLDALAHPARPHAGGPPPARPVGVGASRLARPRATGRALRPFVGGAGPSRARRASRARPHARRPCQSRGARRGRARGCRARRSGSP